MKVYPALTSIGAGLVGEQQIQVFMAEHNRHNRQYPTICIRQPLKVGVQTALGAVAKYLGIGIHSTGNVRWPAETSVLCIGDACEQSRP